MNHRQHYQTTRPVRDFAKGVALAIALAVIGVMLLADWAMT